MQSDKFTQDLDAAYAEIAADEVAETEALVWIEAIIGDVGDRTRAEDYGKGIALSGTAVPPPSTTGNREPSTGE